MTVDLRQPDVSPTRPEPTFHLVIEEVDEVVKVICQKSSINPSAFVAAYPSHVKSYLTEGSQNLFDSVH